MPKLTFVFFLSSLLFFSSSFALNTSAIELGKKKAAVCAGCHGLNGIAIAPNFPNLAGQKKLYLISAITAYRDNQRNDPTMKAMTSSLTDTDIQNIAAYFANLPSK